MITIAHLLDDFGMGGVTRALTLFDRPELAKAAQSHVVPIAPGGWVAPSLEADLIVDHSAISWKRLVFLASLRARNPSARIVHVEHSYTRAFEEQHVSSRSRFRTMLHIAARLLDGFVCVSQAQCDWLRDEVHLAEEKLRVIHPWSGREELTRIEEARPSQPGLVRLLAYGRYSTEKNFSALIEAARLFPADEVQLTVFGDGPERARLERQASEYGHISVLGPCSDPSRHLAECDAVILPSLREAFGLVATEARMAGRAIIVANIDGLPEQVGSAGLIAPLASREDIQTAIRWAMRAPLSEMGQAGRAEVAGQHRAIIDNWLTLIAEATPLAVSAKPARQGSMGGAIA